MIEFKDKELAIRYFERKLKSGKPIKSQILYRGIYFNFGWINFGCKNFWHTWALNPSFQEDLNTMFWNQPKIIITPNNKTWGRTSVLKIFKRALRMIDAFEDSKLLM